MATVRAAIETLHEQVKADAAVLVPSATSLFACICTRLNLVLSTADLSVTKRLISFALDCFSSAPLMATPGVVLMSRTPTVSICMPRPREDTSML